MTHEFLPTVDLIEREIASAIGHEVKRQGLMKRIAQGLALRTVSSLSRQLSDDTSSRSPLQLRVLLMMREAAPRPFATIWKKLNQLLGWSAEPERTPDGLRISIQDRLDAARLKWLEMEHASIEARQAGLPPIERKRVRDRIQELQVELERLHEELQIRPVEAFLPAREM